LGAVDRAVSEWVQALRTRHPDGVWSTGGLEVYDYPGPPRQRGVGAMIEGPVRFLVELARGDIT
jgi:hypothetical protein